MKPDLSSHSKERVKEQLRYALDEYYRTEVSKASVNGKKVGLKSKYYLNHCHGCH